MSASGYREPATLRRPAAEAETAVRALRFLPVATADVLVVVALPPLADWKVTAMLRWRSVPEPARPSLWRSAWTTATVRAG